jgi:hypothetical protein
MTMKHFSHVLALATSAMLAHAAAAPPYSYTMDGETFVAMLMHPEPLTGYNYTEREKAYSYLDGLKDATQGRVWCDVNQLKTVDMAYDIAGKIAKLKPAERKKSAAVLLLDILHSKYPCHGGKQ